MELKWVILSLGSNIENRKRYIEQAISELKAYFPTEIKQSRIYETEPWGFDAELPFLNCCVGLKSSKTVQEILKITQKIEKRAGRLKKTEKNIYQSRTIDIDIIFVENTIFKNKDLEIPHPRLYDRNFVLTPLLEIFPDFVDPLTQQSIQELADYCNDKNNVVLYKD